MLISCQFLPSNLSKVLSPSKQLVLKSYPSFSYIFCRAYKFLEKMIGAQLLNPPPTGKLYWFLSFTLTSFKSAISKTNDELIGLPGSF